MGFNWHISSSLLCVIVGVKYTKDGLGLQRDIFFDGELPVVHPPPESPCLSQDRNVMGHELDGLGSHLRQFTRGGDAIQHIDKNVGDADLIFQDLFFPLGRQKLGHLVHEQNMVVHLVTNENIGLDEEDLATLRWICAYAEMGFNPPPEKDGKTGCCGDGVYDDTSLHAAIFNHLASVHSVIDLDSASEVIKSMD